MNLADFKRWHWIVVGLLAGLAFGGIRHWAGSDSQTYDNVNRTLNSQAQFEQGLTNTVTLAGGAERPVITDVVVYPQIPGDGFQPVVFYEATLTRQPFDPAQPDGPRKGVLYRNLFEAPVPYQPQLNAPAGAGPGFTVRDYLAHVKASGANITYRYAWWWEPRWNFLLCAAAGVVLIGGIWPSVVNLLIGAGLGPKPSPKLMDLSRYGKGKQTPTANAATTAGDKAKFDELEAAMMAKLDGFGANRTGSVDEDDAEHAAKVKQLENAPLEPTLQGAAEKTEAQKRYEGTFYPVAKPVTPKKD